MFLKFSGGDSAFISTVFSEEGIFTSISNGEIVYETASTTTIFRGSGFVEAGGAFLFPALAGTVDSVDFTQGGDSVGFFSGLDTPMSTMLPAILSVDGGDLSGLNALLSSDVLNIGAFESTTGFELPAGIALNGGVNFTGSQFDDLMTSGSGVDKLFGKKGDDVINAGGGNDRVLGNGGDDKLNGGAGKDTIDGGGGSDIMNGGGGNDKLTGKGGNDQMNGGGGKDNLIGGTGNDIMKGGGGGDKINGQAGNDVAYGGNGGDTIDGLAGADELHGDGGNDIIRGGDGNDFVYGGKGNDILGGGSGQDFIYGGAGNDFIAGGAQKDVLTGGANADQFVFSVVTDSGRGAFADEITDFEDGTDFIDISAFGATFVTGPFSGTGAEVRIKEDSGNSQVLVDVDGDGTGDMAIDVTGVIGLDAGDFVL